MASDGMLAGYAWYGALVVLRLGPIVFFSPAFGGAVVPKRFRIAIALILSATLAFQFNPMALPTPLIMTGLAAKELIVGATLAVLVTLVFEAFAMVGAFVDHFRGSTVEETLDPTNGQQASPFAVFYKLLTLVLFLAAGGYAILLNAVADSVRMIPLTAIPPAFASMSGLADSLAFFGRLMMLAVQISAPVLILSVVIDISAGILARFTSVAGMQSAGTLLKAPLGVLVCLLSLTAMISRLPEALTEMIARITRAGLH